MNIFKFLPIVKKFKINFLDNAIRYFVKKKYSRNTSISPFEINNNYKIINDSFKLKKIEQKKEFAQIIKDEKWLYWRLMECPYKKDIFFSNIKTTLLLFIFFLLKI